MNGTVRIVKSSTLAAVTSRVWWEVGHAAFAAMKFGVAISTLGLAADTHLLFLLSWSVHDKRIRCVPCIGLTHTVKRRQLHTGSLGH